MDSATLQAIAADPVVFRQHLLIDCGGSVRGLGEAMTPRQRADFEAADPAWRWLVRRPTAEPPVHRFYRERGRGGSKTMDTAVSATWGLLAPRRLAMVAAAADQDQARLLRDKVLELRAANPWLGRLLKIDKYMVTNPHTGSALEILAADEASSWGLTPDAVLVDEIVHWPSGSKGLWHSLFSASSKRPGCIVQIITNAGFGQGSSWQWSVREVARESGAWHFSRWAGPAEWLGEGALAEQRAMLPASVYSRLFENTWTTGSGDAIDEEQIVSACVLGGPCSERVGGHIYRAGVDLGLKRDFACMVVLSRDIGHYRERGGERRPVSRMQGIMGDLGSLPK